MAKDRVLETMVAELAADNERQVKEIAALKDALAAILRHTYAAQNQPRHPILTLITAEAKQALKTR